jgi:signal transduction histidine kinase
MRSDLSLAQTHETVDPDFLEGDKAAILRVGLDSILMDDKRISYLINYLKNHKIQDDATAELIITYKDNAINIEQWDNALTFTNLLGDYFIFKNIDHNRAYALLDGFYKHLPSCKDQNQKAVFYIAYAEAATYLQNYQTSLDILDEAIAFLEQKQDSSLYEFGYAYLKAGENSGKINNIAESVEYFETAKKIFTHQNNQLMYLWAQNGLSQLYSRNGLYDQAKAARQEVFEKGRDLGEYQVVAVARLGACTEAYLQGDAQEELSQIRMALAERNETSALQNVVDVITLSYAVMAYARNGKIDSSNIYKEKLEGMEAHLKSPFLGLYRHMALSENALSANSLDKAEVHALTALESVKASNEVHNIIRLEGLLGNIYEEKGMLAKAIEHYRNYARIKDSIDNSISRRRYAYVQTLYETEKKDLEIARQRQDIVLLNAKNKEKTYWMLFGFLILITGSGFLWIFKSRSFARKQHRLTEHFSQELLRNQERERKHISRELHDGIGQQLTLITKRARDLQHQELLQLSQQTLEEVRAVSRGLRPPALDQLGLTEAIRHLIYDFDEKYNIIFTTELDWIDACFDKESNVNLYRFIQEAITNIVKHADATEVLIALELNANMLSVLIEDNGKGFDYGDKQQQHSLGLKTMKERVKMMRGELEVITSPNKGTTIKAILYRNYGQTKHIGSRRPSLVVEGIGGRTLG